DHTVTIAAMDSVGNTGRQSFVLKVTEYNFPPAITSVPRLSARIGSVWQYDVTASDPDGDTVTFTLAQGPDGMTVNGATGGMEWTPSPAQAGVHLISVQALDGKGGIGSQSFELSAHVPGPALEVISVMPDDGTTNVLTSENTITWTFSAPVDPATVEGQFLIYYTDWETTAPIPVTWSLSPDLRSLTATVSNQFQYTPPKMWGSHLPVPCEPGYFPGSYGRTGYPLTMITGRLFDGITDRKGNPLVPFRSGFSMFRRFIWIGSYSHHLTLSPDGKRLVSHRSPGTAPGSGVPVNVINADWESPEGHMQIASFNTSTASSTPFNSFFSPDSRIFYCCSNTNQSRIYLFDMETLEEPTFIATPDPPHQIIPTKDFKKAYVYFNCKSGSYPLQHVDILDIDPDSPTYHQWIALNVFGDFGYSGTIPRAHFTMLPDGRRMFLCRNTPNTPDPFMHWGVADIDPLSSTFHQFIYAKEIASLDDYTPPYQVTPNGKWLFGSPAGHLSCGSCAYFSRKLITEEDPALWVTNKVWANAVGYSGSDQMGCAPDSRTIYWGTLNRYIMVFDIDRGTWIDADQNPETRQLLTGDHGGFKGDFPEGISLIRNQLWNWWGSQVWGNVAAPCLVPEHNKFFYFAGGSLICEAIPTVPNPWLEPPQIEIIAPTLDAVLGCDSVTAVGTVADNHGLASVTVNGKNALVEGELFSAEIPLSPGENIITAHAVDADGNASEDSVTVFHDPEAPAVMITSPATASHIRHAPVIVQGTVDDQDIAAVNLNDEDVALLGGAFQKTLPVAEGVNLFHAAARNAAGKTGHGFCVVHYRKNHAPAFAFTPIESAEEGSPYACPATAADPDGDVLEYSLLDAPDGLSMDARTGLIQWTPSGFDIGLNHVAVMARDGWGEFDIRRFHITVIAKGTDISAPRVRVIPETAAADVNIFFNVVVESEDDTGITSRSLEVNGKGTALTFDPASGNWQAAVRLGTTGENTLCGTALDASGNRGEDTVIVYVYDSKDVNPPNLKILAPVSGATLTEPADVYCVIGDIHMDWWVLEYALKGDDNFMELARGTQSFTGVIHTLVPDTILPGAYILRLRARDKNFLTSAVEIEFTKEDYALGYNEYEATDMSIPMMGMNLEVKRRYNSFNKTRGEFGVGWRLEDMNFILNINEDYDVIIRKPDGSTAFFLLDYETIYPFNPRFVRASCKPFGPTVDKLDFSGEHILFVTDTKTLLTWPDLRDFQPETFTLTTPDGRAFTIKG
ncbi:MAG TPA: putative Ig domain-containing protein, partial [Candidatus Sumerlaeota bacterium]|nr:putative Ig domain-containing protein [Candidatus Sumerlaeota bacterium]